MKPPFKPLPPDQGMPMADGAGEINSFALRWARPGPDRPGVWLQCAAGGLCVLAATAAAGSFTAQYRLVYAARHLALVAGLEAAIPDAAALVFACLGVALALYGRHAVRAGPCPPECEGADFVGADRTFGHRHRLIRQREFNSWFHFQVSWIIGRDSGNCYFCDFGHGLTTPGRNLPSALMAPMRRH